MSDVRQKIMELREESLKGGRVSSPEKAVISAAIFTALRCEPCYKAYLTIAHELGADLDYVVEVFSLVMNAQGCVGDVWGARAIEFFKHLQSGKIKAESVLDSMCDILNPERMANLIASIQPE
ncbi:MAG: carboxymuconolactone decarboxylase family protein [Porticoccus sp.]